MKVAIYARVSTKDQPGNGEKCQCRAVLGFQNKAVGIDREGCPVHDLTFAELEAAVREEEKCESRFTPESVRKTKTVKFS